MEQEFLQLFEHYGIYAVFALCTVEGDITLLLAGVLAHNGSFGPYSFLKVYLAGTLGGMAGDTFGYFIGRLFQKTVKNYAFYKMAQPRIERLVAKFGGFSVIVSKYIYGIRVALCLFNGVGRMPFHKFIWLDFISCSVWVLILASVGYFFSGAITTIIGDVQQIGVALFFFAIIGIVGFYLVERFLLSQKIEEAVFAGELKFEEIEISGVKIRQAKDTDLAVWKIGDFLIMGSKKAVERSLQSYNQRKISPSENDLIDSSDFSNLRKSKAIAVTFEKDLETAGKIVNVLGKSKENAKFNSKNLTETRFVKRGIERRYVSDFGFAGTIIEQFGGQ